MSCPNKNTQEWKDLVANYGELKAYQMHYEKTSNASASMLADMFVADPDRPPLGSESSVNRNLESFINNLGVRLLRIKNLAYNEKDKLKKDALYKRADVLEEQLNKLKTTSQVADLVSTAKEHIRYVENMLSKPNLTLGDLQELSNYLSTYYNFVDSILTASDKDLIEQENEAGEIVMIEKQIYKDAYEVQMLHKKAFDKLQKINNKELVEKSNKDLGTQAELHDIIGPTKDATYLAAGVRTSSMMTNHILAWINSIRVFAIKKADREVQDLLAKERELLTKLKNSALFQSRGWNLFIQKDSERNLVNKYSNKYWKENSAFYSNLKSGNPALIKQALKWYKDNMQIVDLDKFVVGAVVDPGKLITYREELTKEVGEAEANDMLQDAIDKFAIYQEHRTMKIGEISNTPGLSVAEKGKLFNDWEIQNSPVMASKRFRENSAQKLSDGKYPRYAYWEYFTARPKDINGNHDQDYKAIEADANVKAYYEFMSETLTDNFQMLPQSFISNNKINSGLLPYVQRTLKESHMKDGASSLLHASKQWLVNKIATSKESNIVSTEVNKSTGEYNRSLPIRLFNSNSFERFNSVTGKMEIDYSEMSMDLSHVMKETIQNYVAYKHKSLVEDKILFARNALNSVQEDLEKKRSGGEAITSDQGLKNIKLMADHELNDFYGTKNNKTGVNEESSALTRTIKENEDVKAIEEAITQKEIELETATGLKKLKLADDIKALQEAKKSIGKNFFFGQVVRSLINYVSLKTQAFNVIGPLVETIGGNINLISHAHSELDYDMAQYGVAMKLIHTLDSKTKKVLKRFNVVKGHSEIEPEGMDKVTNGLTYLNAQTDIKLRGTNAVSVMIATKLDPADLKSGESASFYDILDEDGNPNPELFTEEGWAKWNPEAEVINNYYRLDLKIKTLNDKLFGAYDPDNTARIKTTAAGAALMQFKTFIVEGIYSRWESAGYNPSLQRETKGRYLSFGDLYKKRGGIVNTLTSVLQGLAFSKKAFADLSPLDQANMKKNIIEIYAALATLATMQLLAMALSGDDEDEKQYSAMNLLFNTTMRVQTDLMYYINPAEAKGLTERTFPVFQLYSDVGGLFSATLKNLGGEHEIRSGAFKGWNPITKEGLEMFPISTGFLKLYKQGKEIINK